MLPSSSDLPAAGRVNLLEVDEPGEPARTAVGRAALSLLLMGGAAVFLALPPPPPPKFISKDSPPRDVSPRDIVVDIAVNVYY